MSEVSNFIVRLKPQTSQAPIKRGYPWVYYNEIVLDRRTKAIQAGQIVQVQSSSRVPLATAAFNANSKITLRILDLVPKNISIPLILAGGIGFVDHILEGLNDKRLNAVSTAHLFNFIGDGLKEARENLLDKKFNLATWDNYN